MTFLLPRIYDHPAIPQLSSFLLVPLGMVSCRVNLTSLAVLLSVLLVRSVSSHLELKSASVLHTTFSSTNSGSVEYFANVENWSFYHFRVNNVNRSIVKGLMHISSLAASIPFFTLLEKKNAS